jgi:large subunit ribosomal protein L15
MYIPRSEKASRKRRGTRSCGWGRVGQHRKSGRKGGRGRAGMHKHKWSWVLKYERDHFGKRGFQRPPELTWRPPSINVGELEELVDRLEREGRLEVMEGRPLLDGFKLGFLKVLGGGVVSRPIVVRAQAFTKRAADKLREAGGEAVEVKPA